MKLSEKEIRDIIREELESIPEQENPSGPGSAQIKKANLAMDRIQPSMTPIFKQLKGLGTRARVNFALRLVSPLGLEEREILLLKQELDKIAKQK
jgi:hypothetical protein